MSSSGRLLCLSLIGVLTSTAPVHQWWHARQSHQVSSQVHCCSCGQAHLSRRSANAEISLGSDDQSLGSDDRRNECSSENVRGSGRLVAVLNSATRLVITVTCPYCERSRSITVAERTTVDKVLRPVECNSPLGPPRNGSVRWGLMRARAPPVA